MISVIICSRYAKEAHAVYDSIAATIGVPFEVITIDNSLNKYGMCSAYNKGASESKYDLLCFAHEDIRFKSNDWGIIVANILQDHTIGVLGVAGGTLQLNAPAGYAGGGIPCTRMQVMHTTNDEYGSRIDRINPTEENLVDVATADGLWLCTRKEIWEEFKFDEHTFPEFHFYDVDFCTRIFPRYRVCITFDILIEHFSLGSFDNTWYRYAVKYYRERRNYLPFGVSNMSKQEEEALSFNALRQFTSDFIDRNISVKESVLLALEFINRNRYRKGSVWLLKKALTKAVSSE